MESVLPFLVAGAMALTVIALFAGIVSFGVASRVDAKHSTRLMAARVAFQGLAVALFGLMTYLATG